MESAFKFSIKLKHILYTLIIYSLIVSIAFIFKPVPTVYVDYNFWDIEFMHQELLDSLIKQYVTDSKELDMTGVRLFAYRGVGTTQTSRAMITEDFEKGSGEISLTKSALPVNSDDYFSRQLTTHLVNDEYAPLDSCWHATEDDVKGNSFVSQWIANSEVTDVYSFPVTDKYQSQPKGYIALSTVEGRTTFPKEVICGRLYQMSTYTREAIEAGI